MKMELRQWQKDSVNYFFEHDMNALFNVPTGAGKTFVAIYILKRMMTVFPNIRVLIIVPKNIILEMWTKELYDAGFHFNKIGIVNGTCKEYSQITITTTSSIYNFKKDIFDFLIADEVHNMGTPGLLKVLKMDWKYKLGLTATTERSDSKHWKIFEAFKFQVYEYSVKKAIKDEVLNKFEFYDLVLELNDDERQKYDEVTLAMGSLMRAIGGYNRFRILPNTDRNKLALMKLMGQRKEMIWNHVDKLRVVANICKAFHKESKIIVFSQYNAVTNNLFYYLGSENVKSAAVHSNMKDAEKKQALKDFENDKFNVILATKMLDEGFNLPKIDIGIILAGEKTPRQTIQRMGRVLRKKEKISKLFQLYVADTFESEVAENRSKFFQELCEKYEKIEV